MGADTSPFSCRKLSILAALLCATMFSVHSTASVKTIQPTNLSDERDALLSWSELTVRFKDRAILNLSSPGSVYSGRVLGILGPSGSGKTTFLNVLSGGLVASDNLVYSGKMHSSDGQQLKSDKIAFIYQDDSFFSQLSVRETLQLAASLRLYNNSSQEVINEIIEYLTLQDCADSLVGEISSRGISGGERKRLAVACEMLGSAPALLVADEPSSGLDSFQAKQVVIMLKKIAVEKNIAVVCAIHQPRSSIWNIFDDILLLAPGGTVIYHGPRDQALNYFASIGHECPANTNPAEFLIDLVSFASKGTEADKDQILSLATAFSNSVTNTPIVTVTDLVTRAPTIEEPVSLIRGLGRSTFRFLLLFQRALRQTLRDNATNFSRLAVSSLLATLLGSMYGKGGGDQLDAASVSDKVTLIAHASINVGMLSMVKALQLFKRERAVVDRERVLGRYTAGEYLAAKMFAELPIDAFVGAAFGYIVHNRGNLQSNNHVFAGVLALVSCVTSSLGLAVGAAFPTGDVALAVGPALMVVYVILGAVGPAGAGNELPFYLAPLQKASPIRWACEALCAAELRGRVITLRRPRDPNSPGVKLGLALFSKSNVQNFLRSGLHMLGAGLRGLGEIMLKVGTGKIKRKGVEGEGEGDRTLALLSIPDASISKSSTVLLKMLAVHIVAAWMGLVFSKPKRTL